MLDRNFAPATGSFVTVRRTLPTSLTLLLLALALMPAGAAASPREAVSFEARELLNPAQRDATLNEIAAFGVTRIRQQVVWARFAPKPNSRRKPNFNAADPNAYPAGTWGALDALIAAARARGIDVQLTVTGPVPTWATAHRHGHTTKPSVKEFRAFATAVGRRYATQVSLWSIWNEPNQPQFLAPQFVGHHRAFSPGYYRKLYLAGYAGIRSTAANAHDKILIGETSPRGGRKVVAPLAFLRGMACLNSRYHKRRGCKRLPTSGYAHHAYTTSEGPRFRPPNPDDVTIGVLSRLVRALDKAGRAGALPRHLPIYLTEFGIQSFPDHLLGVSLGRQAAYMAISEHIAYVNSRVVQFSQYLMRDDLPTRKHGYRYGGFESGLRTWRGKRKPSYAGFRLPLAVERSGGSDIVWGLVRPDRARTQVTLYAALPHHGWRKLRTLTTTSNGAYGTSTRHRRGQRYRVRWRSPSGTLFTGATIHVY
jgi:hypothetical protein